jgi:hypothetical protein
MSYACFQRVVTPVSQKRKSAFFLVRGVCDPKPSDVSLIMQQTANSHDDWLLYVVYLCASSACDSDCISIQALLLVRSFAWLNDRAPLMATYDTQAI